MYGPKRPMWFELLCLRETPEPEQRAVASQRGPRPALLWTAPLPTSMSWWAALTSVRVCLLCQPSSLYFFFQRILLVLRLSLYVLCKCYLLLTVLLLHQSSVLAPKPASVCERLTPRSPPWLAPSGSSPLCTCLHHALQFTVTATFRKDGSFPDKKGCEGGLAKD